MSARRPTIGITTYGPSTPAEPGELALFSLPTGYVDAVAAAGGVPVLLAASALPAEDVLAAVDALIVAGGGDIAPDAYGGAQHETIYSVNPARDSFELRLVRAALERPELPLLGICRGMQVMNIALAATSRRTCPTWSARRCCTARRRGCRPGTQSRSSAPACSRIFPSATPVSRAPRRARSAAACADRPCTGRCHRALACATSASCPTPSVFR
jgi:gamma-glutamyl-gamma-aminobutyrate hydrolase PuuD